MLHLFVYGSLKRDEFNFQPRLGKIPLVHAEEALAQGALYTMGYSGLAGYREHDNTITSQRIYGSSNYTRDMVLTGPCRRTWRTDPWEVEGELLIFPEGTEVQILPMLDGFEGYSVARGNYGRNFYSRTLIPVLTKSGQLYWAWTYECESVNSKTCQKITNWNSGIHLSSGGSWRKKSSLNMKPGEAAQKQTRYADANWWNREIWEDGKEYSSNDRDVDWEEHYGKPDAWDGPSDGYKKKYCSIPTRGVEVDSEEEIDDLNVHDLREFDEDEDGLSESEYAKWHRLNDEFEAKDHEKMLEIRDAEKEPVVEKRIVMGNIEEDLTKMRLKYGPDVAVNGPFICHGGQNKEENQDSLDRWLAQNDGAQRALKAKATWEEHKRKKRIEAKKAELEKEVSLAKEMNMPIYAAKVEKNLSELESEETAFQPGQHLRERLREKAREKAAIARAAAKEEPIALPGKIAEGWEKDLTPKHVLVEEPVDNAVAV